MCTVSLHPPLRQSLKKKKKKKKKQNVAGAEKHERELLGVAGIAGALILPVLGARADMGVAIFIKILLVIIIGGMGSMPGALLAALIIGLIESFGYQFVGGYNELVLTCQPAAAPLLQTRGLARQTLRNTGIGVGSHA